MFDTTSWIPNSYPRYIYKYICKVSRSLYAPFKCIFRTANNRKISFFFNKEMGQLPFQTSPNILCCISCIETRNLWVWTVTYVQCKPAKATCKYIYIFKETISYKLYKFSKEVWKSYSTRILRIFFSINTQENKFKNT